MNTFIRPEGSNVKTAKMEGEKKFKKIILNKMQ